MKQLLIIVFTSSFVPCFCMNPTSNNLFIKEKIQKQAIEKEVPLSLPHKIKNILEISNRKLLIVFETQSEKNKYASLTFDDAGGFVLDYSVDNGKRLSSNGTLLQNNPIQLFKSLFQATLEANHKISIKKNSNNEILMKIPIHGMKKTTKINWFCDGEWLIAISKNKLILWKIDTANKIFSRKRLSDG